LIKLRVPVCGGGQKNTDQGSPRVCLIVRWTFVLEGLLSTNLTRRTGGCFCRDSNVLFCDRAGRAS